MKSTPHHRVRLHTVRHISLSTQSQARGQAHAVFHGLGCTVATGRQEAVGAVSELNDAAAVAVPLGLRVAP